MKLKQSLKRNIFLYIDINYSICGRYFKYVWFWSITQTNAKGIQFHYWCRTLSQPEFAHMVYEVPWYQAPRNKWCTISTCSAWWWFKCQTVLLKKKNNSRMRDIVNPFTDVTTNVFVTKLHHYHKCWLKCITNRAPSAEKIIHLQNIKVIEGHEMVFQHVKEMIFRDHEIRTLKGRPQ